MLIHFPPSFQDDNFSLSLLNELSVKYGIQTHLSHSPLPQKLEELREYLRREIKKELKIKEGAENLRKVAKDKKSVSDVNSIVKKSNSKLTELQMELQELDSQILVSSQKTPNTSLSGERNNRPDSRVAALAASFVGTSDSSGPSPSLFILKRSCLSHPSSCPTRLLTFCPRWYTYCTRHPFPL